MAIELILKVKVSKGEGKGSAEPSEIVDQIAEDLLDGNTVYVSTNDGDDEREYVIDEVRDGSLS